MAWQKCADIAAELGVCHYKILKRRKIWSTAALLRPSRAPISQASASMTSRHTFAALAIEAGVDVKTLQSMMGHSSIRVTLDIYGHLYSTAYERASKSLENLVSGGLKVVDLSVKTA